MLESNYLKEQFEKEYSREEWSKILREIFNATLLAKPKDLALKPNEWQAKGYELGSFETHEDQRLVGIFEIEVPVKAKLQHNRKGLRDLLKNEVYRDQVDAALLVFKQGDKWRFSYVSQIRVYNKETGKREVKATDPKRYTYLMGRGERCKTAADRFARIQTKENLFGKGVTLASLEDAFSVEKMSDDFFKEYRRQYGLFTTFLTGYDENIKKSGSASGFMRSAFDNNEKQARDFIKKLLGRIVFLYFLEKKGWLGVKEHEKWGTGDEFFLSNLFKDCRQPATFYSDVLVPLFFKTLNRERPGDLFDVKPEIFRKPSYNKLKIPYLNGGLFEEDGVGSTLIPFPQQLFKGLFDFFDQYNFTVYEDSPDEHTVAVDPEMLGHIFENLLEDNKDKGTYYTPKEIVHYMCQESLIEYLFTKLNGNVERADIERFIKYQEAGGIVAFTEEILQAVYDVKVCDPAIGSGAFPMGILTEILHAVETLYYLNPDVTEKIWGISDWQPAKVKTEIIQNSIYGVDIEQGAVDIARLRFWLSLVVDEEILEDEKPKPLPNLDYKIVVGNSLISKLDEQVIEIDWNLTIKGNVVNDVVKNIQKQQKVVHKKLKSLFDKQRSYFDYEGDKTILKEEIRLLKIDVLIEQIQLNIERNNLNTSQASLFDADSKGRRKAVENMTARMALESAIIKLNGLKRKTGATVYFFDWKLDFPEVMNEEFASEIGFDIVLGNPPYVDSETMVANDPDNRNAIKLRYDTATGNWDLFVVFVEKGISICKSKAAFSFIIPNKILSAPYTTTLRELLAQKNLVEIRDYSRVRVFKEASVYPVTLLLTNEGNRQNPTITKMSSSEVILTTTEVEGKIFYSDIFWDKFFFDDETVGIVSKISHQKKLREHGLSVTGAATVGEAYLIKEVIKDNENIGNSKKLINTGTIDKWISLWGEKKTQYIKGGYIYPIVSTSFINKMNPTRAMQSDSSKIVVAGMSAVIEAFLDVNGEYIAGKSTSIILGELDVLKICTAYLNSKAVSFFVSTKYHSLKMSGGYLNIGPEILNNIPLPVLNEGQKKKILVYANAILSSPEISTINKTTKKIDYIVYKSYNFSYEEASIIEGNTEWMSREDYEKQP